MATITALAPIANGRNLLPDPRLTATAMSLNGATVVDTRPSSGSPDGGSFFRRTMTTANTTSPMSMPTAGTGTSGIPVSAGLQYTGSWDAAKSPTGGPTTRMNVQWYNAAGVLLSTTTGAGQSVTTWGRVTQTVTAPANAAFATPLLQWSGTALVAQVLDFAQAQFEPGAVASDFTDNQTIHPLLVLNYGYARGSQNVVHEVLAGNYPAVSLRPAQSKSGTLSLLFGDRASARGAEDTLTDVNRFHFTEPTVGEDFHFIASGPVNVRNEPGTTVWIVDVVYREVTAA